MCELRRPSHNGLDKGEAGNALARAAVLNRLGELRESTHDSQQLHDLAIETRGSISYRITNPHEQGLSRIRVLLPAQYFFFGAKPVFQIKAVNAAPAFKQLVSSQRNSAPQSGKFLVFATILGARRSCTLGTDCTLHTRSPSCSKYASTPADSYREQFETMR